MTKIMVFGGLGFIGSHVVDLLHNNKNNQLFIFDDESTGTLNNIRGLISTKHNTRIHYEQQDIKNPRDVDTCMDAFRPDFVILLAAQAAISKSIADPKFDWDTNVGGMLNVIKSSQNAGVQRIIFTSTSAVYQEKRWGKLIESDPCFPGSPYGISKLAAEHYLRTMFERSVILRLGNVYGPRQVPIGENQVIPRAIRHFKYGDRFQVFGDGNQTRDYVYVEDVADAVLCAMTEHFGTYNVATGKRRSVNDVVNVLADLYGVSGYPWEYRTEGDPRKDICLDVRRSAVGLGWKSRTDFRIGLQKTMDWWELNASANLDKWLNECEVVNDKSPHLA